MVNKPKKQTLLIILLMICLCTTFISFFIMEAKELKSKLVDQYNSALQMIMDKKYDEAIQSLKELGDYQNAYFYIEQAENYKIYDRAMEHFNDGRYDDAKNLFLEVEDFKDSKKHIEEIDILLAEQEQDEATYQQALQCINESRYLEALKFIESLASKNYKESKQLAKMCEIAVKVINGATTISAGTGISAAILGDGTVLCSTNSKVLNQSHFSGWFDIDSISVMGSLGIGLKTDGTVVTAGKVSGYKIDTEDWNDIIKVSAGDLYIAALTNDGRVLTQGHNGDGQRDVNSWSDIKDMATGWRHTVGIDSKGHVYIAGVQAESQLTEIAQEQDQWNDVIAVAAGGGAPRGCGAFTVGLRNDGTAVAVGDNSLGQCNVDDWTGLIAISAGQFHTIGLREDGTVLTTQTGEYDREDIAIYEKVSSWTDIVAVAAGYGTTLGLKGDGTLVSAGYYLNGQLETDSWQDVLIFEKE